MPDIGKGRLMPDEDEYRAKAEALLRLASTTDNMKQRGELIDQAMHWHNLAMDAHESRFGLNDNDDEDDDTLDEARA
jgi:hypothetical protein